MECKSMIPAVSTTNINTTTSNRQESFKRISRPVDEKKSTFADKAAWTGVQFAKGAAISIVWDSILNGINLISKKGNKITIPEMAKNAGTFGLLWIAVGLVVDGFDKLYRNKQS